MIKLNDSLGEKYELEKTNDDIDFSQILSHFIRKKNLIIASTILGILVGGLTALTKQRLWRGEFQIVIDTGKNKNLVNQSLLKLSGLNDLNALNETSINPLETEVAILKSPSVLMNVFEFVKLKKKNDNLRFNKWKDNSLNINLQKKTSVLNISYTDSNKEIILTVLDKISKTYQNYSGLCLHYFQRKEENCNKVQVHHFLLRMEKFLQFYYDQKQLSRKLLRLNAY